jgi:hypothetical protein
MVSCIIKLYIYIYICVCVCVCVQLDATYCSTLRQIHGKTDHTKPPDTITHTLVYHNGRPGSIVSPDDGQGTVETCRNVLNKITTISDIKLDTYTYIYILFYDARNNEPKKMGYSVSVLLRFFWVSTSI